MLDRSSINLDCKKIQLLHLNPDKTSKNFLEIKNQKDWDLYLLYVSCDIFFSILDLLNKLKHLFPIDRHFIPNSLHFISVFDDIIPNFSFMVGKNSLNLFYNTNISMFLLFLILDVIKVSCQEEAVECLKLPGCEIRESSAYPVSEKIIFIIENASLTIDVSGLIFKNILVALSNISNQEIR